MQVSHLKQDLACRVTSFLVKDAANVVKDLPGLPAKVSDVILVSQQCSCAMLDA